MAALMGLTGQKLDLNIRQGGTFGPFTLNVKNPDGTPVNLTNILFKGQIRKTVKSRDIAAEFNFAVVDPATGKVSFGLEATQTSRIPAGLTPEDYDSEYVYDIKYQTLGGKVLPLLYGKVKIFPEVTR